MPKRIFFSLLLFLVIFPTSLLTAREIYVPSALSDWSKWVLHEKDKDFCPPAYNSSEEKECLWPGRLEVSVNEKGASFRQTWTLCAEGFVPLPGDGEIWPQNVMANESPTAVTMHEDGPSAKLKAGEYRISGNLKWSSIPQRLKIPDSTGLVTLTVNGKHNNAVVDDSGYLWLYDQASGGLEEKAENRMDIKIFRLFEDKTPLEVTTMIQASISGEVRRETLSPETLLGDSIPASISSPLPLKIDEKGEIKFEARPGLWNIEIKSVIEKSSESEIKCPAPFGPEVWTFKPRPELRSVKIEGGTPVDPVQTTMPEAWRGFASYMVKKDDGIAIKEIRRGSGSPTEGDLTLFRDIWLDFDGKGAIVRDQINGKLDKRFFLGLESADYRLGRVTSSGRDQLITKLDDRTGIEMEKGGLNLAAVSRMESLKSGNSVPVGWNTKFQKAEGSIHIPPGWRLLAVSGATAPDRGTWIDKWSLLDFFIVMIISVAVAKIWGLYWGLTFLAGLVLISNEAYAPKAIWVFITITAALSSVIEKKDINTGKAATAVRLIHTAACILVACTGIMFCYNQIRLAVYPQLEKPWIGSPYQSQQPQPFKMEMTKPQMLAKTAPAPLPAQAPPPQPEMADESLSEARPEAMPEEMTRSDKAESMMAGSVPENSIKRKAKFDYSMEPQEKAITQTGPGLPEWTWTSVPVKLGLADGKHKFSLWLSSPLVNSIAGFARVILFIILASRLININMRKIIRPGARLPQIAVLAALAILSQASHSNASDIPGPEILKELEARLLKPADCFPECASVPYLKISVNPDSKSAEITMDVNAAIKTAVPLPSGLDTWKISKFAVYEAAGKAKEQTGRASILHKADNDWVLVNEGVSKISITAIFKSQTTVRFSFPVKPMFVEVSAAGWNVSGVDENQQVQTELALSKESPEAKKNEDNLEESASSLKGYLRVTRSINMGLEWKVVTKVERLFENGGPSTVSAEIPLINGEIVHNSKIKVKNRLARVEIGPGENSAEWNSSIPVSEELQMKIPENAIWGESWHVNASSLWHISSEGVPEVNLDGQAGTFWYPRQGETIVIRAKKLEAAEGESTTIDSVRIDYHKGEAFSRIILGSRIRTSQGGILPVKPPSGCDLKTVRINGSVVPIAESSGKLNIPLQPGSQNIEIEWTEKEPDISLISKIFAPKMVKAPEINLGRDCSNITVNMHLPEKMWLVFTSGPRLGPAVLFWGYLILVMAGAIMLGRFAPIPVSSKDWVLLGLGLAPLGPEIIIFTVLWFGAITLRDKKQPERKIFFRLMQSVLFISTIVMIGIIYEAIRHGLLGIPDMQISGNGSGPTLLKWTVDRSGEILPTPRALMFSIYVFRLLMFAWAAWLAFRITEWAKWTYSALRQGGVWSKTTDE